MTVAVTGANRGIGYAVSEDLVRRGYRVVLVTRGAASGAQAVAALSRIASGPPPVAVPGDLGTVAGVRAAARNSKLARGRKVPISSARRNR